MPQLLLNLAILKQNKSNNSDSCLYRFIHQAHHPLAHSQLSPVTRPYLATTPPRPSSENAGTFSQRICNRQHRNIDRTFCFKKKKKCTKTKSSSILSAKNVTFGCKFGISVEMPESAVFFNSLYNVDSGT